VELLTVVNGTITIVKTVITVAEMAARRDVPTILENINTATTNAHISAALRHLRDAQISKRPERQLDLALSSSAEAYELLKQQASHEEISKVTIKNFEDACDPTLTNYFGGFDRRVTLLGLMAHAYRLLDESELYATYAADARNELQELRRIANMRLADLVVGKAGARVIAREAVSHGVHTAIAAAFPPLGVPLLLSRMFFIGRNVAKSVGETAGEFVADYANNRERLRIYVELVEALQ